MNKSAEELQKEHDLFFESIPEVEFIESASTGVVSRNLSQVLKSKNISQKNFAEMLGKRPSEISKWLSGEHNFTYLTLVRMCYFLKIDPKDILPDLYIKDGEYKVLPVSKSIVKTTNSTEFYKGNADNFINFDFGRLVPLYPRKYNSDQQSICL